VITYQVSVSVSITWERSCNINVECFKKGGSDLQRFCSQYTRPISITKMMKKKQTNDSIRYLLYNRMQASN